MIFETVVSTLSPAGTLHLAPMGVRYEGEVIRRKAGKAGR